MAVAKKKAAKRGHPTRGDAPQSGHVSVKFTEQEGRAIDRAMVERRVSKSDLVREGLLAIGVLDDPEGQRGAEQSVFVLGGAGGDALTLRFGRQAAARLAYDILAGLFEAEGRPEVTLQGRFVGSKRQG